jgi:hypothetical protein
MLLCFAVFFSFFTQAKPLAVDAKIYSLQTRLYASKTLRQLNKTFPLSATDEKTFLQDVGKNLDQPLPAFEFMGTKLLFPKDKVEVDFRSIDKKLLWIKGKKISIEKPISYLRAKILIQKILEERSAYLQIYLPPAHASFELLLVIPFLARLLKDQTEQAKPQIQLEQLHINELRNSRRPKTGRFEARTFTCKGDRLLTVQDEILVEQGKPVKKRPVKQLTLRENGFDIRIDDAPLFENKCLVKANVAGIVEDDNNHCYLLLPKGKNIFDTLPFMSFPLLAAACCAKAGCYETVTFERDSIIKEETAAGPAEPSGAR